MEADLTRLEACMLVGGQQTDEQAVQCLIDDERFPAGPKCERKKLHVGAFFQDSEPLTISTKEAGVCRSTGCMRKAVWRGICPECAARHVEAMIARRADWRTIEQVRNLLPPANEDDRMPPEWLLAKTTRGAVCLIRCPWLVTANPLPRPVHPTRQGAAVPA